MNTSELLAAVRSGAPVIADLAGFDLFAVQWDEREAAVTAAFEGPEDGRNTFHLRFPGVTEFEVRGWGYEPGSRFERSVANGRLSVKITGPSSLIHFLADTVYVVDHRT